MNKWKSLDFNQLQYQYQGAKGYDIKLVKKPMCNLYEIVASKCGSRKSYRLEAVGLEQAKLIVRNKLQMILEQVERKEN